MKIIFKITLLYALTFLIVTGAEIELSKPRLLAISPAVGKSYDKENEKWVDIEEYEYLVTLFAKNTSGTPLTVATGDFSKSSQRTLQREVILSLGERRVSDDQSLIIPSRSDLGLVELRDQESAMIQFKWKADTKTESITVTYHMEERYDGRFGYWTGKVSSESTLIPTPEDRKSLSSQ